MATGNHKGTALPGQLPGSTARPSWAGPGRGLDRLGRLGLAREGAEGLHRAGGAGRLPGEADPPAVEDEQVARLGPARLGQHQAELVVDLLGGGPASQTKTLRNPEHVGV